MMADQTSFEVYFKNKFKTSKWLCFQNKDSDLINKTYINKDFYGDHKNCTRTYRCNKKNESKCVRYCEDVKSHANMSGMVTKSNDAAYETAVPNTLTYNYEGLGSRAYNCKFTSDGTQVLVTTQCGTAFFNVSNDNQLELTKTTVCDNIHWAVTDSQLSSDNKFMLHVTMNQYAHMFDMESGRYIREFNLSKDATTQSTQAFNKMRIYSLDLSGNNSEIIVGCNKMNDGAPIKMFDLETETVKNSIISHKDDINSVCYLDKDNSSIFITASDDGTAKLWDTRILKNNEPVGIFYGHVSGLTYVESKKDNRYFITNSKDQSLKLWDIRNFCTQKKNHPYLKYDYRCEVLTPEHIQQIKEHQKKLDSSVMTFWGHQVHLTLMRCHFSPLYGTNQRYIYTGSFDGRVYIYDTVSGENIVTLELPKEDDDIFNCPVVRDCVWHPYSQSLINTSFHGGVYRWEYMDLRNAERIDEEGQVMEDADLERTLTHHKPSHTSCPSASNTECCTKRSQDNPY